MLSFVVVTLSASVGVLTCLILIPFIGPLALLPAAYMTYVLASMLSGGDKRKTERKEKDVNNFPVSVGPRYLEPYLPYQPSYLPSCLPSTTVMVPEPEAVLAHEVPHRAALTLERLSQDRVHTAIAEPVMLEFAKQGRLVGVKTTRSRNWFTGSESIISMPIPFSD